MKIVFCKSLAINLINLIYLENIKGVFMGLSINPATSSSTSTSLIEARPQHCTPMAKQISRSANTCTAIPCQTIVQRIPQKPKSFVDSLKCLRQVPKEECPLLNKAGHMIASSEVLDSTYTSAFTGAQRINQVLRWVSVAGLAANEFMNTEKPSTKLTPEIQAVVLPGGKILLGQNEDNKGVPDVLLKVMTNKEAFDDVTGKIRLKLESRPEEWEVIKLTQRLTYLESLYDFVNNVDGKAEEFINSAIKECESTAEVALVTSMLDDVQQAFKKGAVEMVETRSAGGRWLHAEQNLIEFVTDHQQSIYQDIIQNAQLTEQDVKTLVDKWEGGLPIFIAGGKAPCLSCQTMEGARDNFAADQSTKGKICIIRAEDAHHDGTTIVGEIYPITLMSMQQDAVLNSPGFKQRHVVVSKNDVFTRRPSASHALRSKQNF